jgi:hypothetical protein
MRYFKFEISYRILIFQCIKHKEQFFLIIHNHKFIFIKLNFINEFYDVIDHN